MSRTLFSRLKEFDISRGSANPESRAAHEKIIPRKQKAREEVFEVLARFPAGLTREEIAAQLGKAVHAICPRVTELLEAGRFRKTGHTRPTKAGHPAAVLVAVDLLTHVDTITK